MKLGKILHAAGGDYIASVEIGESCLDLYTVKTIYNQKVYADDTGRSRPIGKITGVIGGAKKPHVVISPFKFTQQARDKKGWHKSKKESKKPEVVGSEKLIGRPIYVGLKIKT